MYMITITISVNIYKLYFFRALTKHLSPPIEITNQISKKEKESSDNVDNSIGSFVNLEELISNEEANVLNLLTATRQVAPAMLGKEGVKKTKNGTQFNYSRQIGLLKTYIFVGEIKISSKVIEKALEYYEQILWAEVGNYLEHVILWWACSPLSARPPRSSQHLREWINHFVPTGR